MSDDLIRRQAALDALESIGSLDTEADRQYARTVFENLPSVQQWIPCSERLPDKECFVLVTVNDGAIYTDLSLFRHDGRFIEHTGDVIAWQPLPVPYKGGEINV